MTHHFSKAALSTAFSALFAGSALLLVAPAPANAAPQERTREADLKIAASKLAEAEPTTTSSISKVVGDEQPVCDRPRRRLWVEGEGWVVRRVSSCH